MFFSCTKNTQEQASIIPSDALVIMKIDAESLIRKSEYDIFKNPQIVKILNMAQIAMSDKQKEMLNEFKNNANSLGLNIKNDIYVYNDSTNMGIIINVLDSKKIEASFLNSGFIYKEDLEKYGDLFIISKFYPEFIIAWDNNNFLLKRRTDFNSPKIEDKKQAIDLLKNQMSQVIDKSILSNKQFQVFKEKKEDIGIFYDLEKIGNVKDLIFDFSLLHMLRSKDIFKGIKIASYINFDEGEVNMKSDYLYSSEEIKKNFITNCNHFFGSFNKDMLRYIPENNIFNLSANLKGQNFSTLFKKQDSNDENKLILSILDQIKGDVSFALYDVNDNEMKKSLPANYLVKAKVDNPQVVLDSIKILIESNGGIINKIDSLSSEIYFSSFDEDMSSAEKHYLLMKDKVINITNDKDKYVEIRNDIKIANANANKTLAEPTDKALILNFNVEDLASKLYLENYYFYINKSSVSLFQDCQFTVNSKDFTLHGKLTLKEKNQNSLKSICIELNDFLTKLFLH